MVPSAHVTGKLQVEFLRRSSWFDDLRPASETCSERDDAITAQRARTVIPDTNTIKPTVSRMLTSCIEYILLVVGFIAKQQ